MKRISLFLGAALAIATANGYAQDTAQTAAAPLGQHPAVIVQARGEAPYDYASKLYAHPAGLALLSAEPRENGEHPAVQVAHRRATEIDANSFIVGHPASPTTRGDMSTGTSLAAGVSNVVAPGVQ